MPNAVRLPRLLGSDFGEVRRVHPSSLSLELQRRSCSTAQLVLPEEEARLPILSFLELYTAKGSAGIYRVVSPSEPVAGTRTYSLRHAIDTLRDSRWKAQDYDFSGTMAAFLTALLAQQAAAYWQLGTCQDSGIWTRSGINYDSLDELLDEVRQDRNDYIFTYDFSTTPWTLNFVHASGDTVDCELRLSRNLSDGQLRRTRDGMCNILYLSVSTTTDHETAVTYQTYRDAASIAQFGPIEGTAGIDTADVADPAAWAAKFLQDHAWPIAQASADGFELVKATGEAWDEMDIGKTARLSVTRDGFPATFPIETLRYEQLAGETPEKVRLELNRPLPRFSEALAKARETAQRAYGAGRSNQKALKENEHFQHLTKETKEGMEDCFGVIGVKLDPVTHEPLRDAQGNYIWAGPGDAAAEIWGHLHRNAWETQILNHIKDANGNVLSLAEVYTDAYGQAIINAINDQRTGTAQINADRIHIQSTSGSGIVLDNQGNISINAAETVTRINGQTGSGTVLINASKVNIDTTSGSSFSIDANGKMTFNAENAIAAINAATAEINADKIQFTSSGTTVTLDDKFGIDTDGYINLKGTTIVQGNLNLTQNYGVSARNYTVGTGGYIRLVGSGSGEYYDLSTSNVPECIRDLQFVVDPNNSGHYILQKKTIYNSATWTDAANFNIAATQFYQDGLVAEWAAAYAMVDMPDLNTSTGSFDVKVPSSTRGQQDTHAFTVQKDSTPSASGNVSVYMNNLTVARVPIGDWYTAGDTAGYTRGYTAGMNDVVIYITHNGSWYTSWTISSGDSETFYPAKWINGSFEVDYNRGLTVTATGGGSDSSHIDMANSGQIWLHSSDPGSGYTNLGSLGSRITEGKSNGSAYVSFQATCDGGATYKYYKIPL